MASIKARSILQLTIFGFLTVATLLIAALVVTARQLDVLSRHSQQAISEATVAMRASRALIEQTIAMERNAKQYDVLGDIELLNVYIDRRKEFIISANTLINMSINEKVGNLSLQILSEEQHAFEELEAIPEDKNKMAQYPKLLNIAYEISHAIDEWIDKQINTMKQQANHTQYLLKIQALMLISCALLIAGLFTALITRPLRQIDNAIRQLGSGSYNTPVKVQGPLDLQELGLRLDWLRNHLGELERLRTSFIRHVSHEIKTPLTAIQEGVALLNEGLVGALTLQQKDIINILHNNCRRLQQLIENLLRHNIDNLAVMSPMPQPVRLDKVVYRVVADHELAAKTGLIRIEQHLEKTSINGRPEQLRIVVDNLIANAIKYSPPEGTIRVNLKNNKDYAVLNISDEGPGIRPDERNLVFEPFYQGQPPRKKRFQGTGLGLSIASDYVKFNDGTIEIVDSIQGAHFKVQFPLSRKEA